MAIMYTAPSDWLRIANCPDGTCPVCRGISQRTTATQINTVEDLVNFMKENEDNDLVLISKQTYSYIKKTIKVQG